MSQRKKRIEQTRDLLAQHATFTYTDDERNMIECECTWQSAPFLPEPLMTATQVFAGHQTDVLVQHGLL